jgi:hypothetical protein
VGVDRLRLSTTVMLCNCEHDHQSIIVWSSTSALSSDCSWLQRMGTCLVLRVLRTSSSGEGFRPHYSFTTATAAHFSGSWASIAICLQFLRPQLRPCNTLRRIFHRVWPSRMGVSCSPMTRSSTPRMSVIFQRPFSFLERGHDEEVDRGPTTASKFDCNLFVFVQR